MAGASGNVRAGRAFVEIMLDQSKLEQGLKNAQKKIANFGKSLTAAGKSLLTVSGVAAAPFALATKTFADFDDEMRMVKAVTASTEAEFERLTATAEKLGRETSFTAKQVAEGMASMGRMGLKSEAIDNSIAAVLNLSRATGTELGTAAEIAANNMKTFKIESSKMAQVSDILTATANGSAQTLTDLAEGLKMAGPQAAAANDNIINVSGALGVLANMGIKGSLAGTALRKSYSQFAKTKVQDKLKAIGVETVDANKNLRSMPEIMADIAKKMNTMPTAERMAFAEEIFDLRGSLAGLQLGGNIQQMNDFIEKLKNVDGVAAKTADQMDKGIGGASRRMISAIEGVQIAVGRIIGNALAPYMDKLSLMLNNVAEWCAAHKELVITVVKVIASVAALGAALITAGIALKLMGLATGALAAVFTVLKVAVLAPVAAVQGLMAAFAMLKTVMIGVKAVSLAMWSAIMSPAVLAGAALGALVAVVWELSGAWDMCCNAMRGLGADFANAFSGIKEVVGETWEVIKSALSFGDVAGAAKVGLAALNVVWLTGLLPLKKAWFSLKNFLSDSWTITVFSILKLANNLWYGLLTGLKHIGDALMDAWSFIWDGIVGAFEKTILELQKTWLKLKGKLSKKNKTQTEAEIRVLESEYEGKKKAREQKSAEKVNQRAQERDKLNKEWENSNKDIDAAEAKELNDNQQKYNESMKEATAEIEAAKNKWRTAMEEVKKRAESKKAETKVVEKKIEQAQTRTQTAASSVETVSGKSMGAWSAKELTGMLNGNGNTAQERTAKAAESIAVNTKENNKLIKKLNGGSAELAFV